MITGVILIILIGVIIEKVWYYKLSTQKVTNKKTGNIYTIIGFNVICTTDKLDGQAMILYKNKDGDIFAMERKEFWEKFE